MAASLEFSVTKSPDNTAAMSNCVFVHPDDYSMLMSEASAFPDLGGGATQCFELVSSARSRHQPGPFVFTVRPAGYPSRGVVGLSGVQRTVAHVSLNGKVTLKPWAPETPAVHAVVMSMEVRFRKKSARCGPVDSEQLGELVKSAFTGQVFTCNQDIVIDYCGTMLMLKVTGVVPGTLEAVAKGKAAGNSPVKNRGVLHPGTEVSFSSADTGDPESMVRLEGNASAAPSLFKPDWDFEELGIGGLDNEFSDIFRRAFATRTFLPSVVERMGVKHVKGLLLYGPPGTGKTLLARQIGKMLNAKEPIVVNGPEIFNKYVGGSEENVRALFEAAEEDEARLGDQSPLHIIIFDEFDAICKKRGSRSGDTGAGDQVVNQLLSKIDGVNALNNVLLIGMTNRKDMLDEAILRPGRLEVHMEISVPDEAGRIQIFQIHTRKMRENGFLAPDVDIEELAALTRNYTGAEIEGVCKSASSFALNRHVDITGGAPSERDANNIRVTRSDFMLALDEVPAALGQSEDNLALVIRNGICEYGPAFTRLMDAGRLVVSQMKTSTRTPLVTCLVHGAPGTGKSSVAVQLALDADVPFVRLLSPEKLVSHNEATRCAEIESIFLDAYKSEHAVIVLDDLERIIGYVELGAVFSNRILQTLLAYLKAPPPEGHSLLVLATTSTLAAIDRLGLLACFDGVLEVPLLTTGAEVSCVLEEMGVFDVAARERLASEFAGSIPIKRLLSLAEMSLQDTANPVDKFFDLVLGRAVDGMVKLN